MSKRSMAVLALSAALIMASTEVFAHAEIQAKIAELSEQIDQNPDNAELHFERGEVFRNHADWGEALSDYKRVRELDPEREVLDYSFGLLFQQAGMFQRGVEPLALYLERHPKHSGALAARGRVRHGLGQHLEAAVDFTAALKNLPADEEPAPELFVDRARALMAAGGKHRVDALKGLNEGLERLPRSIPLEMEALGIEEALGNTKAALARLQRLGDTSERPERWQVRQAEVLTRAGNFKEARAKYQEVLKAIEATPPATRLATGLAMLAHDVNKALATLETAAATP